MEEKMTQAQLAKIEAEIAKILVESQKIQTETRKIQSEMKWYPVVITTGMFGAALTIVKVFF